MVAEIQKIVEQLVLELDILDEGHQPGIYQSDLRVGLLGKVIDDLKNELIHYTFISEEEEIRFFKTGLPPLLALYIYYSEKSAFEVSEIIGTKKSKEQYGERLVKRIEDFSTVHAGFYEYCCERKTHFDQFYFLRNSPMAGEPMPLLGTVQDPNCFPSCTIKLATIAAYKRLEDEIFIDQTETKSAVPGILSAKGDLIWTASGTDLIELGYALYESGCINNGQANVKDIFSGLGRTFHANPGHYTRVFQELKLRKKNPTVFLNRLTISLKRRLDDV